MPPTCHQEVRNLHGQTSTGTGGRGDGGGQTGRRARRWAAPPARAPPARAPLREPLRESPSARATRGTGTGRWARARARGRPHWYFVAYLKKDFFHYPKRKIFFIKNRDFFYTGPVLPLRPLDISYDAPPCGTVRRRNSPPCAASMHVFPVVFAFFCYVYANIDFGPLFCSMF